MNYHLELFGWCWETDVKTFWFLSWCYPKQQYRALLLFGMYESKWVFKVLSGRNNE